MFGRKARLAVCALAVAFLGTGCKRASVEQLCDKCEECLLDNPSFDEGFCNPFWDGSSFDNSRCVNEGDPDEVEGYVTSSEIEDMSCYDFDDEI